jgi:hypothetical protein
MRLHPSKFASTRLFADPETAARKFLEIAKAAEPAQDGRIYIENLNRPFLFKEGGSRADISPALNWRSPAAG